MNSITALDFQFDSGAFHTITEEAKTFIKNLIVRIPEKRPCASTCLEDPWLSDAFENARLASPLIAENLAELAEVLQEQEELEYVRASLVLRTFLESPYESPAESESESGDEDA